ncbi:MAG: transcription-repair coupling factor, partial [Lachnospiraceae bacterium]|nr:transcription-repair coupling factor [Lachnospiraceae bacterium]
SYIMNEIQKLDIYKRIAGIENDRECDDMKEELLDRFGEIPKSVDNLLRIALIRVNAHRLFMPEVKGKNELLQFQFRTDAAIAVENIPLLVQKYDGKLVFDPKEPAFRYRYKKCDLVEKNEEMLLSLTEQILCEMEELLLEKQNNCS